MITAADSQIRLIRLVMVAAFGTSIVACGGSGWDPNDPSDDTQAGRVEAPPGDTSTTIARLLDEHSDIIDPYFENCYGYAVFPNVGKGGFWVGGAYGRGEVYEQGKLVGTAAVTQLTAGPQIGGQSYSEIVFFEDAHTLRQFEKGNFEFGAQVSAIAIEAGASRDAAYEQGVAIFTAPRKGLMAEATVAGQKFEFEPLDG